MINVGFYQKALPEEHGESPGRTSPWCLQSHPPTPTCLHDCLCPPPVTAPGLGAPPASELISFVMIAQSRANRRHKVRPKNLFNELRMWTDRLPSKAHVHTHYTYSSSLRAQRRVGMVFAAHSLHRHEPRNFSLTWQCQGMRPSTWPSRPRIPSPQLAIVRPHWLLCMGYFW